MSDVFSNMKITPVPFDSEWLKANGSVLVAGVLEVKFAVMSGKNGIYARFPSKQGKKPDEEGKLPWYPEVKIPNKDLYFEFQNMVKAEYNKTTGSAGNTAGEEKQYNDGVPF